MRAIEQNSTSEAKNEKKAISHAIIKSPVDDLMLVADDSALIGVYFIGGDHFFAPKRNWTCNPQQPVLHDAARQLKEYFDGKRKAFSISLRLGGTDFQKRIWSKIALIPYGETITYSDLAQQAGAPEAIRAAGASTGRNPISIIIPCHRVMGKNGSLTGFGGGLDRKRILLNLENENSRLLLAALDRP